MQSLLIWNVLRSLGFPLTSDIVLNSSQTELLKACWKVSVDGQHGNDAMGYLKVITGGKHWVRGFILKKKTKEGSLGGAILWRDGGISGILRLKCSLKGLPPKLRKASPHSLKYHIHHIECSSSASYARLQNRSGFAHIPWAIVV